MTALVTAVALAAAGQQKGVDLPMPPLAFGLAAFGLLCLLLLGTLAFGKGRHHS